jgi:rubrerythrin
LQKKRKVTAKKDITLDIVETAMAEELKARDLYKKISTQLEDKAARLKFDVMSDAEQRHYEQLKKWYEDNYGRSPGTKKIKVAKIVKVKKPEKKAKFEDVINIMLKRQKIKKQKSCLVSLQTWSVLISLNIRMNSAL